jgi:dTDP-4-amino-4,6-dideoxygalactose transaminase
MAPLLDIARKHNLRVIEDAAQAHGAEYRGQRVGSLGDMGCFSFYPGKNLGAYGEGGMVVTNSPDFARTMRMQRDWGAEKKYEHVLPGFNYRMEAFQGAILRVKLRHLDTWTNLRREHAARYSEELSGIGIQPPLEICYARHVYHVYAIETLHREQLRKHLAALNIQTGIHYPYPVHLTPAHADLGYKRGDFPVAEHAASRVLSLPLYPEMDKDAPAKVAAGIRTFPGFRARQSVAEEVTAWSSR